MSKRGTSESLRRLSRTLFVVALVIGAVAVASAADFDSARCERASDLKHWRCEIACAAGETGIATCPSQSAWGACGRQILHQVCGVSEDTPAVACQRKVVLASSNLDDLKSVCEQSFSGFDQTLEGPLEDFPGLIYRANL